MPSKREKMGQEIKQKKRGGENVKVKVKTVVSL